MSALGVRGALVLSLSEAELDPATDALRSALERLGYQARREEPRTVRYEAAGQAVGPERGAIVLHPDGRASYEASCERATRARLGQGVIAACLASVASTVLLGWYPHKSLPLGLSAGVLWVVTSVRRDRRFAHQVLRSLLAALPTLLRADRGPG